MQDGARADFAISAEFGVVEFCGGVDGRINRKHFPGHASIPVRSKHTSILDVIDGHDDIFMTDA
jgi:hypothetical protein